ncbi:NAD(P)H-quinone oxidoreductase subunit S [Nymphaea thermarum]|nr:NAD(P)H-quinone oxidoreductase subunit S [Nymphaea thermarum]
MNWVQSRSRASGAGLGFGAAEEPNFNSAENIDQEKAGLTRLVEENLPPQREARAGKGIPGTKLKAPKLSILMLGMIIIVKKKENPFYMYSGIIHSITDEKAGIGINSSLWSWKSSSGGRMILR